MKKHRVTLIKKPYWIEVEQAKYIARESKKMKISQSAFIRNVVNEAKNNG